jgi:FixJ family two-component response regulator
VSEQAATVLVVDDDPSLCRSLQRLLASAGHRVETFTSAADVLRRGFADEPACLVLDLAMPGMDGLELQSRLTELGWDPEIVFLSGHAEVPSSVQAMKAGAVDFLTKPVDEAALLSAVSEALARHRERLAAQRETAEASSRLAELTPREREVAALVVQGRRNKEIAFELGIAEKTVKVHRGRVMEKTGARSTAELVQLWLLVPPGGDGSAS